MAATAAHTTSYALVHHNACPHALGLTTEVQSRASTSPRPIKVSDSWILSPIGTIPISYQFELDHE